MKERDPMMAMLSSLVAAVSILERASSERCDPKKVVMSDTAFRSMMSDYKKAIEAGRDAINKSRKAKNKEQLEPNQ